MIYQNGVWHTCGKDITYIGKYGSKGHTAKPNLALVGFSHNGYGDFYAGGTPYQHEYYFALNENMAATDDHIRAMGFKVID
mgnify:FL=1